MADVGIEGRRVAIEAIATLIHIKETMAELLLKPAGVPPEVYRPLLGRRDQATGRAMSKRQIAPLLLEAIDSRAECGEVVFRILKVTAAWTSFHLADDEFAARATVQKARELLKAIELVQVRESLQREAAQEEKLDLLSRERSEFLAAQSDRLLLMFDELARSEDHQKRGFLLQDLLNQVFDLYRFPVIGSFARNSGGEQIDGAIKIEGWHYLVECRWRKKVADIRELDGLAGQVRRSGKQAMGLFLSVNGWSENVPGLLKQNPDKSIVLMDGYDLRMVLAGHAHLQRFLLAKIEALSLKSEPFLSVNAFIKSQ
jgi:hypothetical protein